MIRSVATLGLLTSFTMCAPLLAKGDMVLIEIKGADLKAPLKITDPRIQEFNIWAGPGTSADGVEGTEGFIINWRAGVVQQLPAGLQHYRVSFYAGCNTRPNDPDCLAEKPRLVYEVSYSYAISSQRGFVYLHRFDEPGWDVHGIYRGKLEGHWFQATEEWEQFVAPIIRNARR
jgi:hypothetical protein